MFDRRDLKRQISLALILSIFLGGCNHMKDAFTTQEEAREFVLESLQNKYGQEFQIMGKEDYDDRETLLGFSYSCEIAPKDDPEKTAGAVVIQKTGTLKDDWAVYYFKEKIEADVKEKVQSNSNITVEDLSLEAPITSETWTKEDGAEKYMEKSGAYVEVEARAIEGKSDKEYAEIINQFLEPVYELEVDTEISIKDGRDTIFFVKIAAAGDAEPSPFTTERILQEIESCRRTAPLEY